MRFLSYERDGAIRHGRLQSNGSTIDELGDGDLLALLETESLSKPGPATHTVDIGAVRITAPIARPPKLLAVAANYASHILGSGGTPVTAETATPRLFLKPSSAIAAHDATLTLPKVAELVDWEVELAVVIGRKCRNVSVENALEMVGGYMTANDVSIRKFDFGFERDPEGVHPYFDWLAGKWADGFAPFGPYLVTPDEVPEPNSLELHLDVNGKTMQAGSTAELIFGIAELISFASTFMTLEPGDVIETGTPAGAGVETGIYLSPGDVMTARVGHLGEIRTPVAAS